MITVLHRGGYAQMITILHRGGEGLLGTPKNYNVICAQPLKHAVKTRQNLQNLDFSVKSRQNGANSVKVDNCSIDEANMSS